MGGFQYVFSRYEKKYLMSCEQYELLSEEINKHMHLGIFGKSVILNLYYDTPDFLLIRRSIQGDVYKEKLRLRSYGIPKENSNAFIELKKKYNGIVYKRRLGTTYTLADYYLNRFGKICGNSQIATELNYVLSYYQDLEPQMFISYERLAYEGNEDAEFRLTIDKNIIWRPDDLDLKKGIYGDKLLEDGQYLMEVKILNSMPMWLSKKLSELKIFPTSFSKYGTAYKTYMNEMKRGTINYDRNII